MKKISMLVGCCLLLAACNADPKTPSQGETEEKEEVMVEIDWVDFIHWEGKQYTAADSAVLAGPEFLGEKIGEVEFRVAGNVSDPAYQTKNGDAAFREKGTTIYEVKKTPDTVVVPDASEVNGYSLYFFGAAKKEFASNFEELSFEEIDKAEFHKGYSEPQLLNTLTDKEEISRLFGLLEQGHIDNMYSGGDPEIYPMVFYTGEPVAYNFPLFFDGEKWFWHPWDTKFISGEIEGFVHGE